MPGSSVYGGTFNSTNGGNGFVTREGCEVLDVVIVCDMLEAKYPFKAYGSTEVRNCEITGGKASGISFRRGESLVEDCKVQGYYHHGLSVP